MRTERLDIYGEITTQIIEAIEAGADTYEMPWHVNGADSVLPVNASTHRPYRGVNVMMLWAVAAMKEYGTSIWATYQQWRELGAQVRKGEKSTPVVFWKFFDEDQESETRDGNEPETRRGVMARAYHVFNAAQVDGYDVPATPQLPETERMERAEQFFSGLDADIREGGLRAFYLPAEDYIQKPPFTAFKKADFRYSVLAHEITHWSARLPASTEISHHVFRRRLMPQKS